MQNNTHSYIHDERNQYIKIYINGTLEQSATVQGTPTGSSTVFSIGKIANGSEFNGKVSNVRIAHQALYASSFRPPTKPLENITNTKLLCCNNSSVTGSTVTPATITAVGDPTASTLSPFDDPACFTFGEDIWLGKPSLGTVLGEPLLTNSIATPLDIQ